MFTEEQRIAVWQKAQIVEGLDPSMYRKDACGAWMVWDKYGVQDNMYGWEIDQLCQDLSCKKKDICLLK